MTLGVYAQSVDNNRRAAQGKVLDMFGLAVGEQQVAASA
jgi:hypothetical protein